MKIVKTFTKVKKTAQYLLGSGIDQTECRSRTFKTKKSKNEKVAVRKRWVSTVKLEPRVQLTFMGSMIVFLNAASGRIIQ
jgi:hypothetical protein